MESSSDSLKINHNPPGFLSGGGEMGSLTRSYDWASTSIGPMESWPQSLRTTLGILINSKFPMFLFWGKELLCFYNDAYRPSLGNDGKHPSALGKPAKEVWPEIWPVIKPLIDQVLSGGESTWSEDQLIPIYRNGKIEDVYWTFSYSPIYDETGIGGVYVTCVETTKAIQNLHHLEESRNQLEFAIEATELGTWDLNVATNKFTANDRAKNWFGMTQDEEIALPDALNTIDPNDRERVMDAIQHALKFESGGLYNIEYSICNPATNKKRIVRAKGRARFDDNQTAYRFNGTLQDISEQAAFMRTIEESEHLLSNVIQEAPVRISFLTGPEMIIELVNDTVLKSWGKDRSVIGMPLKDALPEMESQPFLDILDQVYSTGIPYAATGSKVKFDASDTTYYFDIWYKPIFDTAGKVYGVLTTAVDVTDKFVAQQKITESEHRFRDVVESAPFPIGVYVGKELRIQLANQTMLNTWGKGNDVVGKLYTEILPELDNQEIFGQLYEVLETGTPFHAKNTHIELVIDGKPKSFYFNYSFTPLYDSSGVIYGVMNTAADVTDVNMANQKAEQSENNLRNTILQAPVSMCILKGVNHFVEIANDRMLELWGKKRHEIVGKNLLDGLSEIKGQGLDLLLDNVYHTGQTYKAYDVPVNLPRANGLETVYVDFTYEAFREPNGSISGVLVVASDVTEQLIARNKIQQAEESARLAIESADLGSYEINLRTDEMQTSERFNDIWGLGRSVPRSEFSKRIHPEDVEIRKKAHEEALKSGNLHYEARVIWNDQSVHWVRIKGKVIYDEDQKPMSLLGVIQDITEQKQFSDELSKQVRQRTLELNRSNEDLLHFAHIASHDLKEPVRKIKVFSNMLEEQFGEYIPGKGKIYIDKIQHATDRMFSMIEGILTYSAMNASDQPIERVDLNEIISNIETDLEILIQNKGATINSGGLPTIQGASVLIYQLFYNLINNALKFSKTDVPSVIAIHSKTISKEGIDFAEISLADNGIGFEPNHTHQIFNAFTRLNAKDKYEGTGLGLALCKKITDRHNGSISATGKKDEGAVFTIMLPIKQSEKIV